MSFYSPSSYEIRRHVRNSVMGWGTQLSHNEWFDDRASIEAFIQAGGSSQLDIEVQNLVAFYERSVGWTADRVKVMLPNGVGIPVRHTRIFHQEKGAWKMVHLHTSIAVPNESIGR